MEKTLLARTYVKGFHHEDYVRKMDYSPFGKTGIYVSKISLGGGTFAGTFYGDIEENRAIEVIREAIRRGINYIDTAPYYGQGSSETIIGKALKGVPREAYYIATKVGRYDPPGSFTQFDYSAKRTKESIEKSLELLGTGYLDVVTIHDIEFEEDSTPVFEECLPTLEEFKKAGKIKFIGVSGYPLSVLKEAFEKAPGRFDTVLAYARNTLIDNSLSDYMPFFKEQGAGVICAAGHAMKLLTNDGSFPWHPASAEMKEICAEAGLYCNENNLDLGRLAMYHFIQMKGPSTFLVGMETIRLLNTNLDVFYHGINEKEHAAIDYLMKNVFSKLKSHNWEGVEIERYREFLKLGLK